MITARPSSARSAQRALWISVLLGLVSVAFAPASNADESAYRYWSFWTVDADAWSYASQGPATLGVADGDVFGWRFGVARESDASAPQPRLAPQDVWQRACGNEPGANGSARVAVILDFGIPDHAPPGESPPGTRESCAVVNAGASGAQVLSAIADVRTDNGLICAFDGYPATECAPSITIETEEQTVQPDHGASDVVAGDAEAVAGGNSAVDAASEVSSAGSILTIVVGAAIVLVAFVAIALLATRTSARRRG